MWSRLKYNKASINKDHKDIRDDINNNLVDSEALIDSKINEENQHNWEKFFKKMIRIGPTTAVSWIMNLVIYLKKKNYLTYLDKLKG